MTLLPIVGRELRVASRRRGTYITRCVGALVVIFLGAWLYFMMHLDSPANVAKSLFGVLGGFAVLYAALSGVQFTADCISSEKREGTLGLLFLTDLKGYDVVLGKLAATSLNAFYALLAIIPVLAIPLLIGGVEPGELLRMSLLAINTLLMSLAMGILVSSLGRSARQCSGLTFLGICVLSLLLPFLGWWASNELDWKLAEQWLSILSPAFAFPQVFESPYKSAPQRFWISMAAIHALTWVFLIGASLVAPRAWQERAQSATQPWRRKWLQWKYGSGVSRDNYRRGMLDINPFLWLSSRVRAKSAMVWIGLAVIAVAWFAGLLKFKRDWLSEGIYVLSVLTLTSTIKVWFGGECTRQLADDKQSGALELLLSTPLTVKQILEGHRMSLQRQFLGPALVVIALQFVFMLAAASSDSHPPDRSFWPMLGFASMGMFVVDLVALYWVGTWAGVRAANAHKASSYTTFAVLVLPWILFAICLMFLAMSSMSGGPDPSWQLFLALWFFIGIGVDLLLSAACRERLLTQFREVAASRFRNPRP